MLSAFLCYDWISVFDQQFGIKSIPIHESTSTVATWRCLKKHTGPCHLCNTKLPFFVFSVSTCHIEPKKNAGVGGGNEWASQTGGSSVFDTAAVSVLRCFFFLTHFEPKKSWRWMVFSLIFRISIG